MDETQASTSPVSFVTTQWTRVLEARSDSPEASAALSDLCGAYYAPVFTFISSRTPNAESARDLTQEFFARLLSRQGLGGVDPARGRFRSYLLGAVKHFLADIQRHDQRMKRGEGRPVEPLEGGSDTSPGLQVPDVRTPGPDHEFDRKWAITVLDRALAALTQEHKAAGKTGQFDTLKPWLTGDTERLSQAEAARQLGMNESAVKVAIHRLRRRFREAIKAEISRTLEDRSLVNEELGHLLTALSR